MRLLHVDTLKLHTFVGRDYQMPHYAILSHTWGEDEFLFHELGDDIQQKLRNPKKGLQKILATCSQAKRDKLSYVWIDTCCIDKSSSAELSEAINSMFKWYKDSSICYAYMEDVVKKDGNIRNFDTSRWFSRGWTLQELIAPHGLEFFDCNWTHISSRWEVAEMLARITGVEESLLRRKHGSRLIDRNIWRRADDCRACSCADNLRQNLLNEPIAKKMKWAAKRVTTREEDTAYCLMGLFDVNMPLLYGEGTNAFYRLQEEILTSHPDQSILASLQEYIPYEIDHKKSTAYLAESPSAFTLELSSKDESLHGRNDIVRTPRGLEIDVLLAQATKVSYFREDHTEDKTPYWLAVLSCTLKDPLSRVAILLEASRLDSSGQVFLRMFIESLIILEPGKAPQAETRHPGYQDNLVVHVSLENFVPRRILLTSPSYYGALEQVPTIKYQLDLHGPWRLQAQHPEMDEKMVLERLFTHIWGNSRLSIAIRGLFLFTNGISAFIVVLASMSTEKGGYTTPEATYISWIERWSGFFGYWTDEKQEEMAKDLKRIQYEYVDAFRGKAFVKPPSELFESNYYAKSSIETIEFLGRKQHTLVVTTREAWQYKLHVQRNEQVGVAEMM